MSAQKAKLTENTMFDVSQRTGLDYVLRLDPDRLLAPSYKAMGKTPKAATYGGWESQQIQGHSLGHYLSALSGFVYYTGNEDAKKKLDYTVSCIKSIQRDDGYFAGIPSTPFDTAFTGSFNVERFSLAGWWVPWYSIHKIYAGLIDAYVLTGNKDALEIVTRMADWAVNGTKNMTHDQFQRMLYCEQGGMCKVFADLYEITGKKEYLDMAERFIDEEVMTPAMKEQDKLTGFHANTQLPKFIGLAKLYDLTGKEEYRRAVTFFFDTVTKKRSYVIGGNSIGEHFGPEYQEKLGHDTCETCNTYNMLELSEYIFRWYKKGETADYYEKALFNHILGSQDPDTGAKTYFVSLDNGSFKVYGTFEDAFWCCTGTGLENPERYNRFIAKEYDDTLYINLFIDSTIVTKDGYKIKIDTKFPYDSTVTVRVLEKGTGAKTIKIRAPEWDDSVKDSENGFITLTTSPKAGDIFSVDYNMKLNVRKTRDKTNNFSILYGPIVLAADYGRTRLPQDIVSNQSIYLGNANIDVPLVSGDTSKVGDWVKIKDPSTLTFALSGKDNSSGKDITLKPFYSLHHVRYSVYFNSGVVAEDPHAAKYKGVTVDFIECGRQQSEVDHFYASTGTKADYLDAIDSSYRTIEENDGGFGYKVKLDGTKKLVLVLSVYGKQSGTLDITLGGKELEKVTFDGNQDGMYDIEIPLSDEMVKELTNGKKATRARLELKNSSSGNNLKIAQIRIISK